VALLRNDPTRAAKALELSLKLGPMPETVMQLAAAYRRAGDGGRAAYYAEVYQRYMDLVSRRDALKARRDREPEEPGHYHELARLYLEAGEPERAAEWLEQARSLRPRDPVRERLSAQATALRKKGQNAPLLPVP
jgi:tetratricopeptide (TPR) repeat protein